MKWFVLSVIAIFCTACTAHYSTNSKLEYLKSRNGPELQVSPPLTKDNLSQFYTLPPQEQNAQIGVEPPID